jgi:hypothetical protein
MSKKSVGIYDQPKILAQGVNGGSIELSFFKSDKKNPKAIIHFSCSNPHGLGYNAFIEEMSTHKEYNKETYIKHIQQKAWLSEEDKKELIDFINQYIKSYCIYEVDVYTEGDLIGYANGYITFQYGDKVYNHEVLYRFDDAAAGENHQIVSIDYGYKIPYIKEVWQEIEDYLKDYVNSKLENNN